MNTFNKFIWEKHNALSNEFCKEVIYKFERDHRKYPGETFAGLNPAVKKSTDLFITDKIDWKSIDQVFCESLSLGIGEYKQYICDNMRGGLHDSNLTDKGYQIQRTMGGDGYYHWHHDADVNKELGVRKVTFIWYLNTVEGGGETEFLDGTKIKPEQGKLIFFPANWTFIHRGIMPPKNTIKYICTGWLHSHE